METLDWCVIAAYGIAVTLIGWWTGRGHQTSDELFLGGRRIPVWAVFCSSVATELSAATFVGTPQLGYGGTWWYLQYAIGSLLARLILATTFLSLYHRLQLVTVYGLLDQRFGRKAEVCSAWFFLVGRILASGSRLFIAGLAFSTVFGGSLSLEWSIVLGGLVAGAYTLMGGIRAVIWTDTLQGMVFLIAVLASIVVVVLRVDGGLMSVVTSASEAGKLQVIHLPSLFAQGTSPGEAWAWIAEAWAGFRSQYLASDTSLITAVVGGFFLTMATHGTDQDMVQRLLATKDGRGGGKALIGSGLANFPIVITFLFVGTGLWAFYLSDIKAFSGSYDITNSDKIFPVFMMNELPLGIRGLAFAGLFAAAMSSMDSALNSLATTWVVNIRRDLTTPEQQVASSRRATIVCGCLLIGAALLLGQYKANAGGLNLISLALSSMTIVYGGLLGGFCVAFVAPSRGTDTSVTVGMLVAAVVGLGLFLHPLYGPTYVAWPWWIPITATVSFLIGISTRNTRRSS